MTNRLLRDAVPLFSVLAAVLLILGIGAIFFLGKEVLVHLALAILLSFALSPIVSWLMRRGLPKSIAVAGAVLSALGLISVITWVAYRQSALLAAQIPSYEPTIRAKLNFLSDTLTASSVFSRAGDILFRVLTDFNLIGAAPVTENGAAIATVRVDDASHGLEAVLHFLEPLLHPVATLLVVLLLAAFMLAQREDLRNRFIRLAGTDDIQTTTNALDDAARRVGRMLLTQLAVNASFGLVIGAGLWLIGLPSPFLWGIFAGVMRFVPYVGAFIGLLPPLVVAFAADPSWWSFIATIGLFAVIEPLVGHVLEPLLYGHSSGMSPVAIIVAALIWAFLWGPIGLVLATPLTICLVVLGRHVPRLKFLDVLLGDKPVLAPHEIFYQRMLAGDPGEAEGQAHEFLKGRGLAAYYDEIALEAIRRAHTDIVRDHLDDTRLQGLVRSSEALVSALERLPQPLAVGGAANAEAEAAFDVIAPDQAAARHIFVAERLKPAWRVPQPVAVLHGDHPLDHAAAMMLGQIFTKYGLPARIMPLTEAADLKPTKNDRPALVFLSFVEPLSTLHLRALQMRVRRAVPKAHVALALWQETDGALKTDLQRKTHADAVITRTAEALQAAADMKPELADDSR
ncbi:MAG TPA: AI-2E family transporter [Aestuariivirga sp.]|nr:AI-2E family transporter [Aestuariivirga sp.]